jgi:hypothetical protein
MKVVRRRDGAALEAVITANHPASRRQAPVLLIAAEPYDAQGLAGYLLADVTPAELGELRRGGCELLPKAC